MKNLLTLVALSAVSACNARNPFDSLFQRMKHYEHNIEQMLFHNFQEEENVKFINVSVKEDESYVTVRFETSGIQKNKVTAESVKGVIYAVIPTREGQTVLKIERDLEDHRVYMETTSEQEVTHEIKDAMAKVLKSFKAIAYSTQKHLLPNNVDLTKVVKFEVSDDSVTIILDKQEAKKIAVTIL
jgi:hypothetical protein